MTSEALDTTAEAVLGGGDRQIGDLVGTIRHRLLINRWVDPDEIVPLLPADVRPRIGSNGGVIAGCCLIALDSVRPWPVPAIVGPPVLAAAHRISVEVGPKSNPTSAVYVPMRHTDSRFGVMMGGRVFPGVHQRSNIDASCTSDSVHWRVQPVNASKAAATQFAITATASRADSTPAQSEEADIVIGTFLGLSPKHSGALEGADMRPFNLQAESVTLTDLSSEFLERFSSAQEAQTLLMTDVGVIWRRAPTLLDS